MDNIDMQEHDRLISCKLLDLVYQRYLISFMSSVLVSVALTAMLWPMVEKKSLLIWLMLLWSVMAVRSYYTRRYLTQVVSSDYGRWRAGMVAGSAAAGASWGLSVFFIPSSPLDSATLPLIFVITGVTAFASVTLAAERRAVVAFILSTLLPLICWLFWYADRLHAYLGVITLVYMGLMLLLSRRMYDLIRSSLSNAERNQELTSALKQVKALEYAAAQMQVDSSYAALFASFEDNIVFVDVAENGEFSIASINPAAEISFGLENQGVRGKSKAELFPPELAARLESYDRACIDSGEPVHYEEVLEQPTGCRYFSITHIPMRDETGRIYRIAAISRDITERKQTESLLLKREAQFRTLAENSPDPIFRYDRECRSVYVNNIVEQLTGSPMSMLLGKSPTEVMPASGSAMVAQRNIQHVLNTGQHGEFEMYFVAADGRELIFHNLLVPEFAPDGSVESVLAIGRDITARKRMEEVLLNSERAYRMLAENSPDNIVRYDRDLRIRYVNKNLEALLAIPATFILGKTPSEAFPDGMFDELEVIMEGVIGSGHGSDYYITLPDIGDGERYHHIRLTPEKNEIGEVTGILAIGRDITERKRTEEVLRESEARYRASSNLLNSILESSPDVITFALDCDCRYIAFNSLHRQTMQAIWGKEITLGMNMLDVIGDHPDRESARVLFDRTLRGESFAQEQAYGDEQLSREYWQNYFSPIRSEAGQVIGLTCFVLNVSENRRISHALAESESRYQQVFDHSQEGLFLLDVTDEAHFRMVEVNPAFERLFGITRGEMIGKLTEEILPEAMAEKVNEKYRRCLKSGTLLEEEIELELSVGKRTYVSTLVPVRDEHGHVLRISGMTRDVTERRLYEQTLQERAELEQRLSSYINSAPGFFFTLQRTADGSMSMPFASIGIASIFALQPEDVAASVDAILSRYHPEDIERILEKVGYSGMTLTPCHVEFRVLNQLKGERWVEARSMPHRDEDGNIRWHGFMQDITERKHTENALFESEQMLQEAQRIAHVGSWKVDMLNDKLIWSDEIFRIWEIDKSEFKANFAAFLETVHPEDRDSVTTAYNDAILNRSLYEIEHRLLFPDGRIKYILERGEPQFDAQGKPVRFIGTSLDITERKHMEMLLKKREGEFRSLAENSPDLIGRFDRECRRLYANKAMATLAGKPSEALVGVPPTDGVILDPADAEKLVTGIREVLASGKSLRIDLSAIYHDGCTHEFDALLVPEFGGDGGVEGVLLLSRDITERKRMEEALSAREREFRSLAENLPDNIARWDVQGRYLYVNPTHERTLGTSAGELIGKPLPDTHANVKAAIAQVLATGLAVELVRQPVPVDGEMQIHQVSLSPERDGEGRIVSVLGLGRNMTEIYRMQDAIAARERELQALAESSPGMMGAFYSRPDGSICMPYVSHKIEMQFGLRPQDVVNDASPLLALTHPEDAQRVAESIAESARSMTQWHEEYRILHPSKGMRWMESNTNPQPHPDGGIVWYGYVHDITERKKMADMLRQREVEFRTLAENAPDPIFRYDLECRRIYVNPAVTRITGQSTSLLGKTPAEMPLVSSAVNEQVLRDIRQVIETGKAHDSEAEYTAPDGRYYFFSNRLGPELGSDGKVIGVVSIMRDISALKRAEAALKEKYARIVELNDYLEENARNLEEQAVELEAQAVELEASQEQIKLTEAWYRGIIHSAPDGMLVVDENGIIRLVNLQLSEMFGYEYGELNGYPIELLLPPDVRESHVNRRAAFFASDVQGRPMSGALYGLRGCRRDGSEFPVDVSLARLPDMEGQAGVICATIRDITERRRVENALAAREKEFRTLVENTPDVIVRYDRDCRRIYVNPEWARVNGIPMAEVLGKTPREISVRVKPIAADYEQKLRDVMASGRIREMDLLWHDEAGKQVCFALSMIPEFDSSGEVSSVLTVARDFSERRRMEDALAIKEQESRSLIDNSPDTISRYDRDCRRIYANPTYGAMVDGGVAALIGKKPSEFPGGPNADLYEAKINEVFSTGQLAEFELKWPDSMGREVCSHIRLAPEYDKAGNLVSVLTVGRDITELNDHRKRIYQMAFYDTLTNLPNRALFNERLQQMLIDASLHKQLGGVMLLDLDRFKVVNDTLGHSAGDDLLREAAMRLTYCVRGYDTVARLGGDEFAILLPEIRAGDDLGRVAGKILESFNDPFVLSCKEVFVSSSIGISVYPLDSLSADDLLKQADSAMYFAKRSGRNNFRFYSSGMTETANERMVLEGDLRRGFVRDELILYFQPKVRLEDGMVIGSEALLRWQHPELGMIPPDKFISIAEDCGLIVEIGEWVLRHACQVACEWNAHGRQHKLAINLSARQFQSNDLLKTVRNALAETGCRPEWIELEITESLLLDEEGDVLEMLAAFRSMGISIAIDDFGTGYSALSYLARFPIDTLKIDRSFTSRITESGHHAELVKAIISIAKCLNQQVVAEGAETAEEVALLKSYGCHLVQGYFYGKPVPKSVFEAHFS